MLKTSEPIEPTTQGTHLFEAIRKQAEAGVTISKAVKLREDADKELDALAKQYSTDHGVGYYDSYSMVTAEGAGKNLMEASMELSRIIASPDHQAD